MDNPNAFEWFMGDMGFDKSEAKAASQVNAEVAQKHLELATMIKRALVDNDDGARLLEYLTNATIMTPMMQVSGALPVNGEVALSPADWAYLRTGQNSVVHFLRDMVEYALNPPKVETETDG